MSGSQSSSEHGSSGGKSGDEASEDESGSGSGSEAGSSSGSGSGSGDGSNSDSDSDSSSGSDSGSGSSGGSSSGEDGDNGSDSEDSGGGDEEEEEEEERDTEEKRLARKREDFEKMKEISAHMDNIVQRLSAFFPRDDKESDKGTDKSPDPPVAPELPVLPLPPPDKAVDRSVPARIMVMDRAVSARQLTTDRAVSVASGMRFDDELSASTISNTTHEVPQNTGRRRAPGNGPGVASRTLSATDADWTERDRIGPEWRVGTRDHHQADEPRAAQGRRESWQGNERNANSNAGTGLGSKREQGGGRRRSMISLGSPAAEVGVESSHERLLWDDLRESLEGAAGGERVPARSSTWARGVAVEKTKEARDREQRRRRLIDEAIAVLLEGSSSSGSGSSSSSDHERLEDGAL